MSGLRIRRLGGREDFRFTLAGVVDPAGARALDRLLLECQARAAREVRLEFEKVESICALGLSVLARWGRVYDETERRILASGLSPALRAALVDARIAVYEPNHAAPGEAPAGAAPAGLPAAEPVPAPAPEAPAAGDAAAPAADELARVQTKLRRKVVAFRNLFEVTQALNLSRELEEVQHLFSLHLMGQFALSRVALFLSDAGHPETVSPRQVRGFPADHFRDFTLPTTAFRSIPPEYPFFALAEVAQTGEGMDGLEALLQSGFEWGLALWVRRDLVGVLFGGARAGNRPFGEDDRELLQILANQAAIAIANARVQRALEERNLGLVRGMMALIESRDVYGQGSTERVVRFVTAVAKLLNYPKPQLKSLIYGAVLRDIGMISVSHLILKSPARLSEEEWAVIKRHPVRGAEILEEMDFPREVIEVVRNHHERWCGEGYPSGIKGAAIPLGARIVALVDAYVAMTAERPYRRSLPYEKARRVIAENWGTPFDPGVVEAFLAVLDRLEKHSREHVARPGAEAPPGAAESADGASSLASKADGSPAEDELDSLGGGAALPAEAKS